MADLESQLLTTDPEVLGLQRQRQLADLLTSQAFNQPQGQMISGYYVAPSALQQALPMIQAAIGGFTNANLDTKEQQLAKMLQQRKNEATKAILGAAMGEELPAQAGPTQSGGNIPIQRTPADMAKALRLAAEDTTGAGKVFMPSLIEQTMPKQIPEQIKYRMAVEGGYKGTFNDFINQMSEADRARINIDKQRLGLEGARLGLEQQKLQAELGGAKLTETQGNATGFGVRAKEANQIITNLENQGVKVPGRASTVVSGIAGMTPFAGEKYSEATKSLFNVLPEFVGGLSPQEQQNAQARKNFISAVLRKESGAAISPQEYANEERKYFPQLGDSDAVVKQKQQARESAIKALEVQAGPGAKFIKEAGAPSRVVNFNDLP